MGRFFVDLRGEIEQGVRMLFWLCFTLLLAFIVLMAGAAWWVFLTWSKP